ncbi:glycosyl hydrolase family 71-domain-containing protein [Podospora australis]|uniref:Glycosyl hydrolase family 71-domain-containing protein n=1 Tax=Podospora australis TaxID=1536484 RepID=A0AAN6WSS5_9PEZI|nr:glycosyl hydrolase family 71-domain-containing protein [Podospora australis]
MAYNEGTDSISIARASVAAESKNLKLFFSFDYAGRGTWPWAAVMSAILNYKDRSAHFRYNGQPFASTFEGPKQAQDWIDIHWAAWPWGPQSMDTYVDASYLQYLNGKPYNALCQLIADYQPFM